MTLRLSRRTALGAIGAGLLAGCVSPRLAAPLRRPLGLADITLRRELTRDYAGTLAKVAAMGFTHFGFRLADPMPGSSEPPARDKAAMVRDAGLEMGPVRFNPRGPNPSREIAIAAEIGASIIALTTAPVFISGGAIGKTTLPEFEAWLPQLIALDEEARAAGLTLAYHNHSWDHAPLDGPSPLERIAAETDVRFEIDCAWAWIGGVAPLALVEKLGPRVVSMHLKDVDSARGKSPFEQLVAPGLGQLDYAALLPNLDRTTDAIGYVEVDNPDDGLAAARTAIDFLTAARARYA
jgi:sugar phosphate isomerase/epimerase